MKTWVIGDLHGCYDSFCALLDKIDLKSDDKVICIGDLINRGPKSSEVLDHFCNDPRFSTIIGNHDWAFILAVLTSKESIDADLQKLAEFPQAERWISWLRKQPFSLLLERHFLVHAGCWPLWSLLEHQENSDRLQQWFEKCSHEELSLLKEYLPVMWAPSRESFEENPIASYAFYMNVLTKIRYLSESSELKIEKDFKGHPSQVTEGAPWFDRYEVPPGYTIVFGHWSALKGLHRPGFEGIDTGCVWGEMLTAFELHSRQRVTQPALELRIKRSH